MVNFVEFFFFVGQSQNVIFRGFLIKSLVHHRAELYMASNFFAVVMFNENQIVFCWGIGLMTMFCSCFFQEVCDDLRRWFQRGSWWVSGANK